MRHTNTHTSINSSAGYTLIELTIALAIIGLFTMFLVISAGHNIKVERYSGNVREIADVLRQAQTASHSVETFDCEAMSGFDQEDNCFWRGTVLEYETDAGHYNRALLWGNDVSEFAAIQDHGSGIRGKEQHTLYDINQRGIRLRDIGINCNMATFDPENPGSSCARTVDELSIAFLAPDGRAFTADQHYTNGSGSDGLDNDINQPPYDDRDPVTLVFQDESTDMYGHVTFEPKSVNVDVGFN